MTNTITLLNTRSGNIATKTFQRAADGRIKEVPYNSGTYFTRLTIDVDGLQDLYDLLVELEDKPSWLIIRGQLRPEYADYEEVTRTLHDVPEDHQVGMFQEWPDGLNWMLCDFDKIYLPEGMTPQQGIERVILTLPEEFHRVSYCYQFSSSAGVVGEKWRDDPNTPREYYPGWTTISVHVFFWLKHKTKAIAQWAKNLNAVRGQRVIDPSPLHTVQPNYTARPKFIGMDDPPGERRSGLVRKAHDDVDLVWIDAPRPFVDITVNGERRTVEVGTVIQRDGADFVATSSLMDRIARIGIGGECREPLKSAIGYYFWLHGSAADENEIKGLLHAAFPAGVKDYLQPRKLDSLVRWYAQRATHPPVFQRPKENDALEVRLWRLRHGTPRLPDTEPKAAEEYDDWLFDLTASGLTLHYIAGECGLGKTEWMVDLIGSQPGRYIICLPRIELIREVEARLLAKFPAIEDRKGYVIKTIFTDKTSDIRDAEDRADDAHAEKFSSTGLTVKEQVRRFRIEHKGRRHVVLFITHAALVLSDWHNWTSYQLIVDEIPDPYQTYTRDFMNTSTFVRTLIEADDGESNYYRLRLTDAAHQKLTDGKFDDNEKPIEGLVQSIARPNGGVYALRRSWDEMQAQHVQLMRLTNANFLAPFRTVTIMGDEFRHSMLAKAFENKYAVDWQPHPDWHPTRRRKTPLRDRVRLFYFAAKSERRGSLTQYAERKLIPKLLGWFDQPENDPGQVLITANRRFEHHFEKPRPVIKDVATPHGVTRTLTQTKWIKRLYVPPRMAGTDEYKDICNVAFFAAMRPGNEEIQFVANALLIGEDDIISWREYNVLFQFVMRGCLRKYDSSEICNVYVWDEYQAEYLRQRFGGCLSYQHIPGFGENQRKVGRPKKAGALTPLERKRKQREDEREAKKAQQAADMVASAQAREQEATRDVNEHGKRMMAKIRKTAA